MSRGLAEREFVPLICSLKLEFSSQPHFRDQTSFTLGLYSGNI